VARVKELKTSSSIDVEFMRRALALARRAALDNEVPVGAVLILEEEVMGEGWNLCSAVIRSRQSMPTRNRCGIINP